jgi:hypothetical protein
MCALLHDEALGLSGQPRQGERLDVPARHPSRPDLLARARREGERDRQDHRDEPDREGRRRIGGGRAHGAERSGAG